MAVRGGGSRGGLERRAIEQSGRRNRARLAGVGGTRTGVGPSGRLQRHAEVGLQLGELLARHVHVDKGEHSRLGECGVEEGDLELEPALELLREGARVVWLDLYLEKGKGCS